MDGAFDLDGIADKLGLIVLVGFDEKDGAFDIDGYLDE